ncbi:alpha-hemoglobin-stabilizing protein isoform 3-T6 [Hipposideros larvatus]
MIRIILTLDTLPTCSLAEKDIHNLKRVGETYTAPLDLKVSQLGRMWFHIRMGFERQMALLQANRDLISTGVKEFNVLLNQQVFTDPPISEEAMVTVLDDWVNFYTNYYRQHVVGEEQERDRALQELRQQLSTLCAPFLDKYRAFLKSLST